MKKVITLTVFIFTATLFAQNFEWARSFISSAGSMGHSIKMDHAKNIYTTGHFYGTIDLDPGPSVSNFSDILGGGDLYITKLDSNGNFLWGKNIDAGIQTGSEIALSNNGIFISGGFNNTVDFDPGVGVYNLSTTQEANYILKLNNAGGFLWAKSFGVSSYTYALVIESDSDGNCYIGGYFSDTADFDPGPGVSNLYETNGTGFIVKFDSDGNFKWAKNAGTQVNGISIQSNNRVYLTGYFLGTAVFGSTSLISSGSDDVFITPLDSTGNFLWAKKIGSTAFQRGNDIATDHNGNSYTTGIFAGSVDFNPGIGTHIIPCLSVSSDMFIVKLDSMGNYMWAKSVSGYQGKQAYSIEVDTLGSAYTTGFFYGTVDFDPSPGVHNLISYTNNDIFLLKLDPLGNLIWASQFAGNYGDTGYDIILDNDNNLYMTGGHSHNIDLDPGLGTYVVPVPGGGSTNISFLSKYSQDICDVFAIGLDSLSNIFCNGNSYAEAYALNGIMPYNYEWNSIPITNDSILLPDTSGVFQITITDQLGCVRTTSAIISGPQYSGIDLVSNMVTNNFMPGFPVNMWLNTTNNGCIPTSGVLKLVVDPWVHYNYSIPAAVVSGDTLIWNFNNLEYNATHFTPYINATTSVTAALGDSVDFELIVLPISGDSDTTNNIKHYRFLVSGSYDPNDKKVYPQGECDYNFALSDEPITYTIRFQNTGTNIAHNVYIMDTLSSNLNLASIRIIHSSHPMIPELLPGGIAKFNFNNIMLPDSGTNEIASNGFIIFEVTPVSSIPNGTIITNSCDIYFDYNAPITTNSVLNTMVDFIPNSNYTISQSSCNPITINGITYTNTNVYSQNLTNSLGCDSTLNLFLTILGSSNNLITTSSCESYTFNSITYSNTGVYSQILTNSVGCDSIITLDLLILDSTSNTITASACNNYTINSETYTSTGTYYQTLSNSAGCDSTLIVYLTINNIDNSISQSGFSLTANQVAATYQWIDCDNSNQPIPGATNQSFTATSNGNYAVIVAANGCSDTSACQAIFGFGLNGNSYESGISISPNPTNNMVNINSTFEFEDAIIELTDGQGKILVKKTQINGKAATLDLTWLKSGMYFIRINSKEKSGIFKVVKN